MARAAAGETVFHAVACPTRRALLDALTGGESSVSGLVGAVGVSQSAVSQQLAVLKGAGLVAERAEGRFRFYRLLPEPLAAVDAWIARYRAHIEGELDALGRVLDDMSDAPPHREPKKRK